MADMKWVFYDFFIIEDLKDHSLWFIANGHTEAAPTPFGRRWKMSLPGKCRPQGIVPDGNVSPVHPSGLHA